jgi:hypothetical protein
MRERNRMTRTFRGTNREIGRCARVRNVAIRWALLGLCVAILPSPAGAVDKGKAKYIGGTLTGVPSDTTAPIYLDDADKLVFVPRTGRIEIPWTKMEGTEYRPTGMVGRSRAGLAVLTPYSLLFTKGRKHLVTLSFKDLRNVRQVAVFEFDKNDIKVVLSLIKVRTGKAIVCEGEDVRNPIEACSGSVEPQLAEQVQARAAEPALPAPMTRVTGPRVRIVAPGISATPIQGELLASDQATITIRTTHGSLLDTTYGKSLTLPLPSVTRFERSVRPSRKLLGAAIGAVIGTAVGFAVLSQSESSGETGQSGAAIGIFAIPGGLIGAVAAPGERWVAEDPRQVRVGAAPAMGPGFRMSWSVRF